LARTEQARGKKHTMPVRPATEGNLNHRHKEFIATASPAGTSDRRPGMSIIGKLFGFTGPAALTASPASETALPGYCAWYAQQVARSYASQRTLLV
jgi:hypothetical protein